MSRKLLVLNLALAVLIGAAVWQIWQTRARSDARESAVLGRMVKADEASPLPSREMPKPVAASEYFDVAAHVLFTRDRNPEVVLVAEAPKPLPPLPYAHGVLDLGSGPTVILSEDAKGASQRAYRVGEEIGGYRIAAITATEIYLDFDGERVRRTIEELKPAVEEQAPPVTTQVAAKPAQPAPNKTVLAPKVDSTPGPGKEISSELRACRPGDTSPPGTVIDGYKKLVNVTPFGKACRWERVK